MGYGNAHKYRPEVQARKAANRANPDWVRRREFVRTSRGLKQEKAKHWMLTWERLGRPDGFPEFDAFWASHPAAQQWIEHRKANQRFDRWAKKKHAAWVAAGMPAGTDGAGQKWHDEYNAATPPPTL